MEEDGELAPQKLSELDQKRVARVFDWPSVDTESKERHMSHWAVLRVRNNVRKMVPVWEVMPASTEKYILVGRLLPRPGFDDDNAALLVEIDTIDTYQLDFGEDNCWKQSNRNKSFTRGLWVRDNVKRSNVYYQLHSPSSMRYSPFHAKISRDLKHLFEFHDALAYTDYFEEDEPYFRGEVQINGHGKYSTFVATEEDGAFFRIRNELDVEQLLHQEPHLNGLWLKWHENAYFVWENLSARFGFSQLTSSFSRDLNALRKGLDPAALPTPKKQAMQISSKARPSASPASSPSGRAVNRGINENSNGMEVDMADQHAPRPTSAGKQPSSSNSSSSSPRSNSSSPRNGDLKSVIQKRKKADEDDVVEDSVAAGSGNGGGASKSALFSPGVSAAQGGDSLCKFFNSSAGCRFGSSCRNSHATPGASANGNGGTSVKKVKPLVSISTGRSLALFTGKPPPIAVPPANTEAAEMLRQNRAQAHRQAADDELQRSLQDPARLKKLSEITRMQKREDDELKLRNQKKEEMRKVDIDKERLTAMDPTGSGSSEDAPFPRDLPKRTTNGGKKTCTLTAYAKWTEGCNETKGICSCRDRGLHRVYPGYSDLAPSPDSHPQNHACCNYAGYHKVLGDKMAALPRVRFTDVPVDGQIGVGGVVDGMRIVSRWINFLDQA